MTMYKYLCVLGLIAVLSIQAPQMVRAEDGQGPGGSGFANVENEGEDHADFQESNDPMPMPPQHAPSPIITKGLPGIFSPDGRDTILERIKAKDEFSREMKKRMDEHMQGGDDQDNSDSTSTQEGDFRSNLEAHHALLKQKFGEEKATMITHAREMVATRFENGIKGLSNIMTRIGKAVERAQAAGKDTADVEAKIAIANGKIIDAENAFEALKTEATSATDSTSVKTAAGSAKDALRAAQSAVKDVYMALKAILPPPPQHETEGAPAPQEPTSTDTSATVNSGVDSTTSADANAGSNTQ